MQLRNRRCYRTIKTCGGRCSRANECADQSDVNSHTTHPSRAHLIELLEHRRLLAAGDVDPTFGTGGFVQGTGTPIVKVITAPSGIYSLTQTEPGVLGQIDVVRILPNGQPDPSFGVNGEVIFGAAALEDLPIDIAPDPIGGGVLVLAARIDPQASIQTEYVTRITAAGAVDSSLNAVGEIIVNQVANSTFQAIGTDASGAIFVGGGQPGQYVVRKFTPGGPADNNFANSGTLLRTASTGAIITELRDTPLGMLAAGSDFNNAAILRFAQTNGTFDGTFGTAGQVAVSGIAPISDLRVDSQGRIVLMGFDLSGGVVARFNPTGTIDPNFGGPGGQVSLGATQFEVMDIGPADSVYVAGTLGGSNVVVRRLLGSDGSTDASYGTAGDAVVPIPSASNTQGIGSIVTLADGSALIGGGDFETGDTFFLARLQGDTSQFAILDSRTGVLLVSGTAGNDSVLLDVQAGSLITQRGPDVLQFALSAVDAITITTFAGADQVTITNNVPFGILIDTGANPSTVQGGFGNDTIIGGGGVDNIDGGDGSDVINGQGGADVIRGGLGDDTIDTGSGGDFADGNDGNDSLTGGDGADFIDGAPGNDTIFGRLGPDTLNGADGDDLIFGEAGADIIQGGLGNDTLNGNPGNDTIDGAGGNDALDGGAGDDFVMAGNGDDFAAGRIGADTVIGGAGADTLDGSEDNDLVDGVDGDDFVSGGDGSDQVFGGSGNDNLFGDNGTPTAGAAADTISGGAGNDVINAGAGNDFASGDEDDDIIKGDAGDDQLIGAAGNDQIFGEIGNDELSGSGGADTLDAGGGNDRVFGGDDNDTLMGGAGIDSLDGQLGRDFVSGGDNNDLLISDDGTIDQLNGDQGIDIARGDFDEEFVLVELLYRFVD